MTGPLVVIACGAAKLDRPAPAEHLYTGSQFRLALQAALQLTDRDSVMILSAKHGLLPLWRQVAPYDLKMGQPGSVTADQLALQAAVRALRFRRVIALTPKAYTAMLQAIWPNLDAPLAGLGIGCQRQVLAQLRDGRYNFGR